MLDLQKTLMERDGLTAVQAEEKISEVKEILNEYLASGDLETAYNICEEQFGLEPDYLMDLID